MYFTLTASSGSATPMSAARRASLKGNSLRKNKDGSVTQTVTKKSIAFAQAKKKSAKKKAAPIKGRKKKSR